MKIGTTALLVLLFTACGSGDDAVLTEPVRDPSTTSIAPVQQVEPEGPIREITNIAGDLYRVQNNNYYTVFLVTPEGTILADPLNAEFSGWLKAELAERFDSSVRYVIYSHHHFDHASGGSVFEDTAEFIGHENLSKWLVAELPSTQVANDANGDGFIQRAEALGGAKTQFDVIDLNGDGAVSGEEFNANIRPPGITYSDRLLVELGGKQVHLVYPGPNHSDDATVLLFPAERAAFGVDFINIRQLGGPLSGATVEEWGHALGVVADLDVDTVIAGHGEMGTPGDVAAFREFLQVFDAKVAAGMANGETLEQIQQQIMQDDSFESYRGWSGFEAVLPLYIRGAYRLRSIGAQNG